MEKSQPKYKIGQTVLFTPCGKTEQENFIIKKIEEKFATPADKDIKIPVYYYFDTENGNGYFLEEDDIDGIARDSIEINEDSLKEDGWEFYSEFDGKITGYKKEIAYNNKLFYCNMMPFSNTFGRNWFVHVDNNNCDSVGTMDIVNFGQLDRFLELLSE